MSKQRHEGYIMFDHRATNPAGVPSFFESATITCSHCQRVVVLNPDRQRSRGYCPKCDHYICDQCELMRITSGYECRTFNQIIEEQQEAALRLKE